MRHNYLNNKDILKEIHKSKNTYCVYTDNVFADYDIIVPTVASITETNTLEARQNRAERLTKLAHEEASKDGVKRKVAEFEIPLDDIKPTDVVFRVTTWDHVPQEIVKKKPKSNKDVGMQFVDVEDDDDDNNNTAIDDADTVPTKYVRLKFPPFFHYKIDESGTPYIVGKSHWKGDLETGEFCQMHGQVTNTLARMYMKLVERYATRSNWRGYTYNDEMRSTALLQLSQIGLQFDESKSQNPFAYYTAAVTNSFTRVLLTEKKSQSLRDDILEANGLSPSYTRQALNEMSREYNPDIASE
jgi:hypothetical protein